MGFGASQLFRGLSGAFRDQEIWPVARITTAPVFFCLFTPEEKRGERRGEEAMLIGCSDTAVNDGPYVARKGKGTYILVYVSLTLHFSFTFSFWVTNEVC